MFVIFGRNLGPATAAQVSAYPLPVTLQGVSIKVMQGSQTVDAYPAYVSATQINAIMPSNAPLGAVAVQVTYNGARSNWSPTRVANSSPGIFTATGYGAGPGILQNFVSATEQPITSAATTVKPGQIGTLWGTGFGPITSPDSAAPPVGNLSTPIQVFIGGVAVRNILYSGRTPCCSGIDQIVLEVPNDAPEGCFVPVQVKAGDAVSNTVTIAVSKDGSACSDKDNPLSTALAAGKKTGLAVVSRVQLRADTSVASDRDLTGDFASVAITRPAGMPFAYDPIISLPPAGSCSAYTANGDLMGGDSLIKGAGAALDAGAVTVTGSRGTMPVNGSSLLGIGGELPGAAALPLFLDAGAVSLRAAGGADIAAFNLNLSPATALSWSNRDSFTAINRNSDVTFRFNGAGARTVIVGGVGVDLPANSSAMFLCVAPAGAESVTVPAMMLSNFPATRSDGLRSPGMLFVGVLSAPQAITATGLDAGAAVTAHVTAKTVTFR